MVEGPQGGLLHTLDSKMFGKKMIVLNVHVAVVGALEVLVVLL